MASPITQDGILDAIRLALQSTPELSDGMTALELAARMNPPLSAEMARKAIKRLLGDGTMEICRVHRMRMDGVMTRIGAYRMCK